MANYTRKKTEMLIPRKVPNAQDVEKLTQHFPGLDPEVVVTHLTILRLAGSMAGYMEEYFTLHSLSEGRFTVLMMLLRAHHLSDECGPVSPASLAEQAGVTRATVTGLLDHLEQDGYVKREPRQDDRRMIAVHITPEGLALLESILPEHFRRVTALYENLGLDERKQLVALLNKVGQGLLWGEDDR